ncbi:MAG: cob(I)yrinic acid a,c-diamide adenosyltransferase [Bacteroidota bacterium]|nr:cob(I)yrinic acid a,c-diamide adenosyltransferase [Bacteroidota bacterium]
MKQKGYVQVYTGNGKGKTTAAFGLALRACGAGMKVFIGQFVKGMHYNEIDAIDKYLSNNITLKQYGLDCFIYNDPTQKDIDAAQKGFAEMKEILLSDKYDMVIFDELNIALYYKLFTTQKVLEMLNNRPENVEIIITGRYAPQEIIDIADLVTEMKEIKHYYHNGVEARKGIEK